MVGKSQMTTVLRHWNEDHSYNLLSICEHEALCESYPLSETWQQPNFEVFQCKLVFHQYNSERFCCAIDIFLGGKHFLHILFHPFPTSCTENGKNMTLPGHFSIIRCKQARGKPATQDIPWKMKILNPRSWRFGVDDFPDFQKGWCFRFQPLIFRGVGPPSIEAVFWLIFRPRGWEFELKYSSTILTAWRLHEVGPLSLGSLDTGEGLRHFLCLFILSGVLFLHFFRAICWPGIDS